MKAHQLNADGIIINTIVVESLDVLPNLIEATHGGIGWMWDGNTMTAPPALPVPVPSSVSPRQIRQALTRAGLRAQVETAVAAGDQDLKDWWEFATVVERMNSHVVDMGFALGQTDAQLDDLWRLAGSL